LQCFLKKVLFAFKIINLSTNCNFYLEQGIDGCVVTDITAEDLSEMGLTLKLGTKKNSCLSYRTMCKCFTTPDSVTPVFQLPKSTPTQDGPAVCCHNTKKS
jgi:hypothetical protein